MRYGASVESFVTIFFIYRDVECKHFDNDIDKELTYKRN